MENKSPARRPRGRPRAFDRDAVLTAAAETFWRLGYEGASVADLTAAMGITPQSLYAAFTSKADLYRETLDWYQKHVGAFTPQMLEDEPDAVKAFERVLIESAHQFSKAGRPHGCMISTAILTCASENRPVAEHVSRMRGATLVLFRQRLDRAIGDGTLKAGSDTGALARYLGALVQGMSVQAQDGASAEELIGIARLGIAELARFRA